MNQDGFTLFEVIIYSAIVAMILTFVLMTFNSIFSTSTQLHNQVSLVNNSVFLEQKVKWALTSATQINYPSVGETAASISFEKSGSTMIFDLNNGTVRLKEGAGEYFSLTDDLVEITSLSFENFSFASISRNTVRVRAELRSLEFRPTTSSIDLYISIQ